MIDWKDAAVVMALPMESQGVFESADIPVIYTGVGKVNATLRTTQLILERKPSAIINLGTAGSKKFPAHALVECSAVKQRDMDLSGLGFALGVTPFEEFPPSFEFPKRVMTLPSGVCGSGDSFEMQSKEDFCDLVDMEAYAIAKVCAYFKTNFLSIKYITDGANSEAHTDWQANLVKAANGLIKIYREITRNPL